MIERSVNWDPSLDDEGLFYQADVLLTALAADERLAAERRAFIRQHVNHPTEAGQRLIAGWAAGILDPAACALLRRAARKRPALDPDPCAAAAPTRWTVRGRAIDDAAAGVAADARRRRVEHATRQEREYHNDFATWASLVTALALAVLGFFLVQRLGEEGRLEDCLFQGRHNCDQILEGGR
jgi:hypothetical protein